MDIASFLNLPFGLAIFLFGMKMLEQSIRILASRRFKVILRNSTNGAVSSVLSGTLITAIVQSSAMVSLVMLAMVGAGILPLMNAIGIILGANVGTTITGWLVAIFGFKLNLTQWAIPLLALGSGLQIVYKDTHRLKHWGTVSIAAGFILFGLQLMKSSVEGMPNSLDMAAIKDWSLLTFLIFGLIVTFIMQSSTAVMLITLSALNANIIELPAAAALMIGADMGAISPLVFGSIKGSVIKKQLLLANFIFNLVVDLIAYFFLLPQLTAAMVWLGIHDPLVALVAFFTLINVIGVLIFIPILKVFSQWIERIYPEKAPQHANAFLATVATEFTQTATVALNNECYRLLAKVIRFSERSFVYQWRATVLTIDGEQLKLTAEPHEYFEHYLHIKDLEGEIISFATELFQQPLSKTQSNYLHGLLVNLRDVVYAAKLLKDVFQNLHEVRLLDLPEINKVLNKLDTQSMVILTHITQHLNSRPHHAHRIDDLIDDLKRLNNKQYNKRSIKVRKLTLSEHIGDEQLSTLFNVIHSRYEALEHLIEGLKLLATMRDDQDSVD